MLLLLFFFFKQKTAYEMRISDWSSDVCSSDLLVMVVEILSAALTASNFGYEASSFFTGEGPPPRVGQFLIAIDPGPFSRGGFLDRLEDQIGRASCRERVCQYV